MKSKKNGFIKTLKRWGNDTRDGGISTWNINYCWSRHRGQQNASHRRKSYARNFTYKEEGKKKNTKK